MNADEIRQHIEDLVAEEHRLLERGEGAPLEAADSTRLADVNVQLDRYYDLLRQRRAREEFGQDPKRAAMRSADTVENYVE